MPSDYEGEIIHWGRDEFGELIVAENALARSLYFSKTAVQSSMLVDFPDDLALHYARAMMSALLFNPAPDKVLLIGLGGGSLVRFLLRICPDCRIRAVEIRAQVIAIAERFFGLPAHHPRLTTVCGDGRQMVLAASADPHERYDLILVDAYDETSRMDAVTDQRFIKAAQACLSDRGLLVFNLWTGLAGNFPHCRDRVRRLFAGACRQLVLDTARGNAILLACNDPGLLEEPERLRPVAHDLGARTGLNFSAFLDEFIAQER